MKNNSETFFGKGFFYNEDNKFSKLEKVSIYLALIFTSSKSEIIEQHRVKTRYDMS
jgi:hypothetical protein